MKWIKGFFDFKHRTYVGWVDLFLELEKTISMIMLIFILASALIPTTYAITRPELNITEKSDKDIKTTSDRSFSTDSASVSFEETSLRTENSKTFRKTDGTYKTVLYNDKVHYIKNGRFEEINNYLVDKGDYFDLTGNEFQVVFPKDIKNKPIQFTQGNHEISWSFLSTIKSDVKITNQNKDEMKTISDVLNRTSATYEDVSEGIDLEYIVTKKGVKEHIILDQYIDDLDLSFEYFFDGLLPVLDKNILSLEKDGETIFKFEELIMFDMEGRESKAIELKIEKTKTGMYLSLLPNQEWLLNAKYPVYIDPSVVIVETPAYIDTFISSQSANTSYGNQNEINVGNVNYENIGLISFNLPSVLLEKNIGKATLEFNNNLSGTQFPIQINVYANQYDFTNDDTWNSYIGKMTDDLVAYQILDQYNPYTNFDVTMQVRDWINDGDLTPAGFSIRTEESKQLAFYSSEDSNEPVLSIEYTDNDGLYDYWTYQSYDAGNAGVALVSDFTGFLTFSRTDLSYETQKQNLSLSFIYSTSNRNQNIGYGFGQLTNYNYTINTNGAYYVKDPTGRKTYFPLPVAKPAYVNFDEMVGFTYAYFVAEDGSGKIFIIQNETQNNQKTYYLYTNNNFIYEFGQNKLTKITDVSSGLTRSITYLNSSSLLVDTITDSSGNYIKMNYSGSNNLLSSQLFIKKDISLFHELANVSYSLSSSEIITNIKYNYQESESLQTADTNVYSFDSVTHLLKKIETSRGESLEIGYFSNAKVNRIESKVNETSFGWIEYTYQLDHTRLENKSKDAYVDYYFDFYGHTVNSMDSNGYVTSTEYIDIASYKDYINYDEVRYWMNNRVNSQSDSMQSKHNPIKNAGFEYTDGWLVSKGHSSTVFNFTTSSLMGKYSAELTNTQVVTSYIYQSITLDAGSYTLDASILNKTYFNNTYIDVVGATSKSNIEYINNDHLWHESSMQFHVANNQTTIEIRLYNKGMGSSYFESIRLYEGFNSSKKNLVSNNSFEEYTGNQSKPKDWSLSDQITQNRVEESQSVYFGEYSMKIIGDSKQFQTITQSIPIEMYRNSQDINVATISSWAKGGGIILDDSNVDQRFEINIFQYKYSDYLPIAVDQMFFDSRLFNWQYQNQTFEIDEETDYLEVVITYQGEGTVYFDGIELYFESSKVNYDYDESTGRLISVHDGSGDTSYTYDDANNTITSVFKNRLGEEFTQVINRDDDSIFINETEINFVYNDYHQITSYSVGSNLLNYSSSWEYNQAGFSQYLKSTTDEIGTTITYDYNLLNGLLEYIVSEDLYSNYKYDNFGRLIKVYEGTSVNEADALIYASYTYDEVTHQLKTITLDSGLVYTIHYDQQNRMESVSINQDEYMRYSYLYDTANQINTDLLELEIYGNGDQIKFEYDQFDRIQNILFKDETSSIFDQRFKYIYDESGRISIFEMNNDGQTYLEYYSYDDNGLIEKVTDEHGNAIHYGYDKNGNVTSLEYEIGNDTYQTQYFYNKYLNFGSSNPYNGQTNLYDKTLFETKESDIVVKTYNYQANALHRLDFIQLNINNKWVKQGFTYDETNVRINKITYSSSQNEFRYRIELGFDGKLVNQIKYYENEALKYTYDYTYDQLERLWIEDIKYEGAVVFSEKYRTNTYTYDQLGNLIKISSYDYKEKDTIPTLVPEFMYVDNSINPTGMYYSGGHSYDDIYYLNLNQTPTLSFGYYDLNDFSLITGVTTKEISSNLNVYQPGYYEKTFKATHKTKGINITFKIIFKVGEVLSEIPNTPNEFIELEYSDNWKNQLDSYTVTKGSMTTTSNIIYDEMGNPISITNYLVDQVIYTKIILRWEAKSLVEVKFYQSEVIVKTLGYVYDDNGFLIEKMINSQLVSKSIHYEYINGLLIYETDGVYQITYRYDYDGSLVSFEYDSNIADQISGSEYYYIRGYAGDIQKIIDKNLNTLVSYQYDAYGNIIEISDTSGINLSEKNGFLYRGYRYDLDLGLYLLHSRYYNPVTRAFINSDSILGQMGNPKTHNLQAYTGYNPVMYTDPSGKFPILITIALILLSGIIVHAVTLVGGYAYSVIASIWDEDIRKDMNDIGWNPFNSDENLVLKSRKVSFYKGSFVVRHNIFGNGSSAGILGIIWLNYKENSTTTVKHEWGHNIQELIFGEVVTLVFFALPSVINYQFGSYRDYRGDARERAYYSKYWERSADFFGGVNRGNYDPFWSSGTFIPWD